MLAVNKEFYSIQTEGTKTGIPMYFVRLQGCSVGCYFCDVKETWKHWHPDVDEAKIVKRASESKAEWVCITGGEPYEQDLHRILKLCKEANLKTCVETSGAGTLPLQDMPNWLSLSPKDLFSQKTIDPIFKKAADEIKVIITRPQDVDYYLKEYYDRDLDRPFIIQPVDTKANDSRLYNYIFSKTQGLPNIRVMVQQHKVITLVQ